MNGKGDIDWLAPIVADAEAGFGGNLNVFEIMKSMLESGAAGVHFEDQLASVKKCGHMGGKVLVPTSEFIQKLLAARLAADILGIPAILVARTDAFSANLITSDIDLEDQSFLNDKRTVEGFFPFEGGINAAIARGLAFAPYADMLWFETSSPDLADAQKFHEAIHAKFPSKLLAYNCSPSFNWKKKLNVETIAGFQKELSAMCYKYQFVTLAGFHALNYSMFSLAKEYSKIGMMAYSKFQEKEFAAKAEGYTATEHQAFVGTGYFDEVAQVISGGKSSTQALKGSTEEEQFKEDTHG
jgi:isocitrate lyase